jgi:arginyl-tRNA synthetase
MIKELQTLLKNAVAIAFPSLAEGELDVAKAKDTAFGDYQCNSAMKLAKQAGMPPRAVAMAIVEALKSLPGTQTLCDRVEVAGPGFINIFVRSEFIAACLKKMEEEVLPKADCPLRVVVDFSSPNIAKEMHVGHLRSTIIGDCLARVFEALGHRVLRLNHVGDWGTAFGMLLAHIKSLNGYSLQRVSSYTLADLMQLYRESKVRFDEDTTFRRQAQQEVVRLQGGNEESVKIWKAICEVSRKAYNEIYTLLGVTLEERGESFYNSQLPKIVQELEEKGVVTVSDGAKCVFAEGFYNREGNPLPLMLQKSDGGYNYDTTDMAAITQRIREEKADRIIYVTDSGQAMHFQMVFAAARQAGILDSKKVRVDHVPFGLVLGPDGKKFRTRSGETEKLIDLLQAAVHTAEGLLREKSPELSDEENRRIAKILGIGAIKYADLSSHRASDYVFSYDRMLRFEGNTAAFIMYSYVRTQSIQRKITSSHLPSHVVLDHPSELALGKALCQFSDAIDEVTETLLPNRLTDYLYGLAEEFNAFFRDCRVEGDPRQQERLFLVALTGKVLRTGLHLLGISVPEKM